jgi:23S rRNA (uracil1939-C5)-methyltransferase
MNCNNQVVTITKMVNGGYGLARAAGGKMVLVRYTMPDETVAIQITDEKNRMAFAQVIDVRQPGSGRVHPPCRYYGRCGGCDLQHVDYKTQCLIKEDVLSDLISRIPGISGTGPGDLVRPVIGSASQFGYRHRIRLKIDERGRPGFSHFRSHRLVGVSYCLLADKRINQCLAELPTVEPFSRLATITEQFEIILDPQSNRVSLLFCLRRSPRPADRLQARDLCAALGSVERVFFTGRNFSTEGPYCRLEHDEKRLGNRLGFISDGQRPLTCNWEIGGFSQVNLAQNAVMVELVLQLSRVRSGDRVLDLYCGMGNFSLTMARQAREVLGIEGQGSAIRSARRNSQINDLPNCRFVKSDVVSACASLLADGERFDVVVCDPPRSGMAELTGLLPELTVRRLVYVSCDPATLCRDLEKLTNSGFAIDTIQPLDMFPQTHHIETIVVLEKSGS